MKSRYGIDFRSTAPPKPQPPKNILYLDNFAAQMVELEIAIEMSEVDVQTLQRLMDFYSRALDHFAENQSNSYIYFKNKIKSLLIKPRVVELINAQEAKANRGTTERKTDPERDGNPKGEALTARPSNSRPSHEFYYKMDNFQLNKELSTVHQKKQVEDLVKIYANHHGVKEEVIKSSLMDQKDSLRKRLEERKTNSILGNSDKSLLSVDKKKNDRSRRVTGMSVQARSEYAAPQRQTVPKQTVNQNVLSEDYNVYEQFVHRELRQGTPLKDNVPGSPVEEESIYEKH
jgi:hypothetical protein